MLREIPAVSQISGEKTRRWFQDDEMDLFVWEDDAGLITAFQLSYDKSRDEKALTWKAETGYLHTGVDDGSRPGHHPGSPLLVVDGAFPREQVLRQFRSRGSEMDPKVLEFVAARIAGYAPESPVAEQPQPPPDPARARNPGNALIIAAIVVAVLLLWLSGAGAQPAADSQPPDSPVSLIDIPVRLSLAPLTRAAETILPDQVGNWRDWKEWHRTGWYPPGRFRRGGRPAGITLIGAR